MILETNFYLCDICTGEYGFSFRCNELILTDLLPSQKLILAVCAPIHTEHLCICLVVSFVVGRFVFFRETLSRLI